MAKPSPADPLAVRARALVDALRGAPPRTPRPMRASVLEKLRMPDGARLSADLACWLAFDASWFPLLRGRAKPEWALAEAEELRSFLSDVGLPRDVPLVALEPAASEDHYLALDPSRGNPVLAWDQARVWIASPTFLDYVERLFPPPRPAPASSSIGSTKKGPALRALAPALRTLTPQALEALDSAALVAVARALVVPAHRKKLAEAAFVEALVRALDTAGATAEALGVLDEHLAATRRVSSSVTVAALALGARTRDRRACEWALEAYRVAAKRDPDSLYFLGHAHALASTCAEVLGVQDEIHQLIEDVMYFNGAIPSSVPVDDPALASVWARPKLQLFSSELRALAQTQAKRKKPKERRA
ncbi:MAG: hypothetical protein K1X94_23980 [Sandaracinaceae bacterium]|nr:hypothetical protein [Sandaracinaceae bacterium]